MKLKMLKPRVQAISTSATRQAPGTDRVRGSRWMSIRRRVLSRDNGLCQHCLDAGRITLAEEVDHVVPLHAGGHATDDSNLVALCKACHKAKSDREEAGRRGRVESLER